jgi:DNA processing protein
MKPGDLMGIDGVDRGIAGEIADARNRVDELEREFDSILEKCEQNNARLTTLYDKDYPENLKTIFDAPVLLFYKGNLNELDKYSISVVGTRIPSEYGKIVCTNLVEGLSELGIPIISGMANGIDAIAHTAALKSNNITYAVLGSGVDMPYPPENERLYNKISESGAVISELDFGSMPDRMNFPRRNRIICGISLGTLVVESALKGGSLITAQLALDQNKEVFAVPGYINSRNSSGTNELIKKGHAKMVTNVEDIVCELEYKLAPLIRKPREEKNQELVNSLNVTEQKIYNNLAYEPMNIDKINEQTGLPISDCLVNLLSLELKGLVRQIPGKNFMKL